MLRRPRAPAGDGPAYDFLLSDLVERLLALSDSPGKSSDFIAEELRALFGAKTVMVFQCREARHADAHRLVSIYPERRRALAAAPGIERLLELSHRYTEPRMMDRAGGGSEREILGGLGVETAVLIPLAYGTSRVGAIVMFDLLDIGTAGAALKTIGRLSSVFALILRNADLYANLEEKVADRTAELEKSLAEKDALLREVHHRVKNNLQIVISFLYLKASGPVGEETKTILRETQERIYAMALAHEELYAGGDFSEIDLADYLGRIVDNTLKTSCPAVRREFRTETLRVTIGEAIPCGLIVSELAMNAVKHAFADRREGTLSLSVERRGGMAAVGVTDDGPGFPVGGTEAPAGIGISIIECLADQIGGRIERSAPGEAGARTVLFFPA